MNHPFQIFGSFSSTDLDVLIFVPEVYSTKDSADKCFLFKKDIQEITNTSKPININLAKVENGVIVAVHKGTIDELNNALFHTYDLHKQFHPRRITKTLPRDLDIKIQRCSRTIISYFTRTSLRSEAKQAIREGLHSKIEFLSQLNIADHKDLGKRGSIGESRKSIAFQLGQTLGLLEQTELYTKEDIAQKYPELAPYLNREDTPAADLQLMLDWFCALIKAQEKN